MPPAHSILRFASVATIQACKITCQQSDSTTGGASDEGDSHSLRGGHHHNVNGGHNRDASWMPGDGQASEGRGAGLPAGGPGRGVVRAMAAALVAAQLITPLTPVAGLLPAETNTPLHMLTSAPPARALLLSPDTKVPKNAEVALRRAVPVVNQELRKIQVRAERGRGREGGRERGNE